MLLVNNVSAQAVTAASIVREGLKQQVTSPVRWEESIRRLRREGVELFVEVGPGKVLSGLVRQIDRAAECLRVEDSVTLNEVVARLSPAGRA
jgi:[acyl-carrier-protein] S-malonyltransferase